MAIGSIAGFLVRDDFGMARFKSSGRSLAVGDAAWRTPLRPRALSTCKRERRTAPRSSIGSVSYNACP